jgi:hypothetical protein
MELRFHLLDAEHKPAWDGFVADHPHAWPGHDTAMVAVEEAMGHRSYSQVVVDENDRVVAVAPLVVTEARLARLYRWRVLSTGTFLRGAPLLAAELTAAEAETFWDAWVQRVRTLARDHHIDEIKVGFPNFLGDRFVDEYYEVNPLLSRGFRENATLTMVMDLRDPGRDLEHTCHRSCRRAVRKAADGGAMVRPIDQRSVWLESYPLMLDMHAAGTSLRYSREALELVWDGLVERGRARVFGVQHDGTFLNYLVVVQNGYSFYFWLVFDSVSRPVYGHQNLLLLRVMEHMRAEGYSFAELGSLDFHDPRVASISQFKRSFGGEIRHAMSGYLITNPLKHAAADLMTALRQRLRGRE